MPAKKRVVEFLARADGAITWKPLTVVHVLSFGFFLAYFGVWIALFVDTASVNLWVTMITWVSIGGIVVGGLQLLLYTHFLRANGLSSPAFRTRGSHLGQNYVTYTGLPFVGKMAEAFVVTGIAWLLGTILQITFLVAFKTDDPGEGCCRGAGNAPDPTNPTEWFAFSNSYELTFVVTVVALITLATTLIVDRNPTQSVTPLVDPIKAN